MKINPLIAATAINRYERIVNQKQATTAAGVKTNDTVEISDRAQLFSSLVSAARDHELQPDAKIHGIINRLSAGLYSVDVDRIAGKMLGFAENAADDDREGAVK